MKNKPGLVQMFGGDRLAFQAGAAPLPLFPIQGSIRIPDWAAQPWSNLHCKQNRPKLHSVTIREGLKNKHIFYPHFVKNIFFFLGTFVDLKTNKTNKTNNKNRSRNNF